MIIGLTGGIASGKSTVTQYFKGLGLAVIDADLIARQVVAPNSQGLKLLVEAFGPDILKGEDLDRKKLRALVFKDNQALALLNGITHPLIRQEIEAGVAKHRALKTPVAILDAALLLENDLAYLVDEVWLVSADEAIQRDRLVKRDEITPLEAQRMIDRQMPLKEKIKKADLVLDNNGSIACLLRTVKNHIEVRLGC